MLESGDVVQEAAVQFLNYGLRFIISDDKRFRGLLARIVENVLRDKHDWFTAQRREIARQRPLPSASTSPRTRRGCGTTGQSADLGKKSAPYAAERSIRSCRTPIPELRPS
jgi:hypothetical protein